ncbi:uncharacterized protein LOC118441636 isoform X2 [Vespa mandarinia]|uniref:uncharacterized protein LOC118441636 isoform X2 n=1 Tax=Vespa mandarinia TaxID=7446 RepID=UPI00161ACCBB|nr:uncharacterized protein LOC118441636 isoform X2 [Vespa mandarinia]
MEENFFTDFSDNFVDDESDSDLESRLYANIHYTSVETETPNEVPITSEISSNNKKNINNTAILDDNIQNRENSSKCADSERNIESSFNESLQRDKEIIRNNMEKVICTDSVQKDIDDPYTFDIDIEDRNNISPMKKNRKKIKRKAKKSIVNRVTQELLNYVFKVPNKLQLLSNNHSNVKQSGISNINTLKNKSIKSRQKKQNIENVLSINKGSKESINLIYTEKHKDIEEKNTKYSVLNKKEKGKLHDIEHFNNESNSDSDSDSDSDESILEVPVPPKPPPPVISLNDSDEDNKSPNKKSTMTKKPLTVEDCNTNNFRDQVKKALSKSQSELTSLNNSEILDDENNMEDIILNCTDIRKGASSITEIKEMSKNVQKKKRSHGTKELSPNVLQDGKINNNKNKSEKKNVDSSNKQLDNTSTSMCSTENMRNDASEVIEVHTNIDFTEDILPVDEFIMSQNESSPNKKRQLECEHTINDNVKRAKISDEFYQSEPSTSGVYSKNKENKDKSNDSSSFHPMSEKLRAFYTNSRGQENFDVSEVQSKMSNPRLWAILDEDLISNSKKRNFWFKCSYCHQSGHERHDCPIINKSLKCYMCGVQGHTGTRCPRRMCLTCGKKQGTFKKTCETCRTLYCTMCNAVGHMYTECPDLWRRYHQTTTTNGISIPSNILGVMKPADRLFCCNCTKRGHDSSMCKDNRWSKHFPTPSFVSNYTDGPTYINEKDQAVNVVEQSNDDVIQSQNRTNSNESNTNILVNVLASDDLLPFPKELLKRKQSQKKAFPQNVWEDETNISYIIYECGVFYTIENNGMEITYTITARKGFNTYYIMERRVAPYFLENLLKLFMFEVKIYKKNGSTNEIVLRIRTYADLINDLRRLILYWLSLEDDEKDYVMFLDLPLKRIEMLKLLNLKMKKLGTESGNALKLYDGIVSSKLFLQITRHELKYLNVFSRIQESQKKLLLILNDHPNLRKFPEEIQEFITILERSKSTNVPLQAYLQILTVYNFIFVPHTPPKSFVTKYGKYKKPNVNKNTRKGNSNANASKGKASAQQNLTIPVIQTDRSSNNNDLRSRKSNQCNLVSKEPQNVNDFIQLENTNATYTYVSCDDTVNEINKTNENSNTENYRTSEYSNLPKTTMSQGEWYNNDVTTNRNIMEYNLPSTSHNSVSKNTTSDKYTNITVNMLNKNQADETPDNVKLNMNNTKTDEYKNIDKCTNIIVSVSNKNQGHTSNVENEKQQNNNKYTNITVSISNKDQGINISPNANNSTNDNCQSTEVNNSEHKKMDDKNDVVCIEIKKKAENQIEDKSQNQDNINDSDKAAERTTKKKGKKRGRDKYDPTTQQLKKTTERCFKLQKLSSVIQRDLSICSSDDFNYWKMFANRIEGMVKMCGVIHIKKALIVLKNEIAKQTVTRKNICMLQKLVNIELQHQEQVKSLYNHFDVVS